MYHWGGQKQFPTVITIFSAPNYCDFYNNKGAVIKFKVILPSRRITPLTSNSSFRTSIPTCFQTLWTCLSGLFPSLLKRCLRCFIIWWNLIANSIKRLKEYPSSWSISEIFWKSCSPTKKESLRKTSISLASMAEHLTADCLRMMRPRSTLRKNTRKALTKRRRSTPKTRRGQTRSD